MTQLVNRQFRLAARPVGMPKPTDWFLTEEPVRELADGEVLTKTLYLSLDPAMRGWVSANRSYVPPVAIGDVMRSFSAGQVIASKDTKFAVGDYITGILGVQEYAISDGNAIRKVNTNFAPLPVYLGTLGMPGMTAYFGLLEVAKPRRGESVVVSAAAGAVGSVVGQIAKIKGCHVVGIAGGPDKCRYVVEELSFDAAIDYKAEEVIAALRKYCPNGVDVYFDNVGGAILDAALANLRLGARVVICGGISQYNNTGPIQGPSNYLSLLVNRASMTGMLVTDYAPRYGDAAREIAGWMSAGKLKSREHIVEGFENFPAALLKLFSGENLGKLVLQLSH